MEAAAAKQPSAKVAPAKAKRKDRPKTDGGTLLHLVKLKLLHSTFFLHVKVSVSNKTKQDQIFKIIFDFVTFINLRC